MLDPANLSLALAAGLLAALNPCGFALLPVYLSLVVAGDGTDPGGAVRRALVMSGSMTVGFIAVFGGFGALAVPLALSLERFLPWVTVLVGVLLVGLEVWLLAGRELRVLVPRAGGAPTGSVRSTVGYGVAYALASLSCTIAPFLAVTTAALTAGGPLAAFAAFVAYGVGMGVVVTGLAVAVATANQGFVDRVRRITPYVTRASGPCCALAGAYVAWFGVYELRVLSGGSTEDPVVDAALAVQGVASRFVATVGPWPFAAAVLLAVVVLIVRARRSSPAVPETGGTQDTPTTPTGS